MGVHDLWRILEPVKENVPLQNLKGKTLAVDMSLWVCEAQTVKGMMGTVIKPYLRNLFFRTSYLTLMDVRLIFVTEGAAPKLKADTMSKRNEIRRGGSRKPGYCTVRTGRSHFQSVLKECCELLDYLGNPWVCAAGEAEAMCAYLNENGYVDGCVTNDGDAFLYGAQTVYRNLTINTKDPYVDCYRMSAIKSKLGLDRDALVGFAILLGCDYLPKGVPGVGKELALRLVETINGQSLLQRFTLWKGEFDEISTHDSIVKKKAHCSVCRHPGLATDHATKGCHLCSSDQSCLPHSSDYQCPCNWHQAEERRKTNPLENIIKKKAKACEHFPFTEVIREFLISKDHPIQKAQWRRPNLLLLQNFALNKMEWPRHYTCEKALPLLSHHDMMEKRMGKMNPWHLQPMSINKKRIRNGIPFYEILWEKPENYVYSDEQSEDSQCTVTTLEEQLLFEATYTDITAQFHREKAEEKEKKHKKNKSKKKDKTAPVPDEITQLMSTMSLQPVDQSLDAKRQLDLKNADQQTNSSNGTHLSTSIGFSTEYYVLPKDIWRESTIEISQSAKHHTAEEEKFDSESLVLKAPENGMSPSTVSPSASFLVAEMHLSDIDWSQSFSTPHSGHSPVIQTEQAQSVINGNCCVPISSSLKLNEDDAFKENPAVPSQECVRKNMELFYEHMPMLQDFNHLPLKERILLKNSYQILSLPRANSNSSGNNNLPCSASIKSDIPSAEADSNSLIEANLSSNFNKEKLARDPFSETRHGQQEGKEIYISKKIAGHHSRPLTVPKTVVKDSRENVFGTCDPVMYSYQISNPERITSTLEKNKSCKQIRMKTVNGHRSTIATKGVYYTIYSSSDDSDSEISNIPNQKQDIHLRAGENTVIPFCTAQHNQPYVQQNKYRPIIDRICSTNNQCEVVNTTVLRNNDQTQLMPKYNNVKSNCVISQKNTCGSDTILLKSPLSSVENLKKLGDDEDSIIIISDSPIPLSERLKV
ncbi:flap endonuclease GEN homolog 1 [Rhinoraja longicauda]